MRCRWSPLVALLLLLLLAGPARGAVIGFDTAPAVPGQSANTIYGSSPGVVFAPPGATVPGGGTSCGTVVTASPLASSSPNGATVACGGGEFPPPPLVHAVFTTKTYRQVSLSVGTTQARTFQLFGYDGAGLVSAQSAPTAVAAGGRATIAISAGDPEIAAIVLRTIAGPPGGGVVIDDLDIPDPPTPGAPNFQIALVDPSAVTLVQGTTRTADVALYRINGSAGAATWSVTGLPAGVTASTEPSVNGRLVRLTASPTAQVQPDAYTLTVTATPTSAATGPAPRSATLRVFVSSAVTLSSRGVSTAEVPSCAGLLLDYLVAPTAGPARWRVTDLPEGVTAQIDGVAVASAPVRADGAGHTVRLTFRSTRALPAARAVRVAIEGTPTVFGAGIDLGLVSGGLGATVSPARGRPPEALTPGTRVTLTGSGLCAPEGARLRFGNDKALAPYTMSADGRRITAEVPRLATTGRIGIVPDPALPAVRLEGPEFRVEGFRERWGFAFRNYTPNITWANMQAAFGTAQTNVSVDPCPFVRCPIVTPVPDPWALVLWGIAEASIGGGSGGVCYGISRTVEQMRAGRLGLGGFPPAGAASPFALNGPGGASGELTETLNANQLAVLSSENLGFYARAAFGNAVGATPASLRAQIEAGLRSGRYPAISLREGGSVDQLHVVLAYDVTQVGADPNEFHVWVYDSNVPFTTGRALRDGSTTDELSTDGAQHEFRMQASRVHVRADGSWRLESSGMSAGRGSLGNVVVFPDIQSPARPTMPGPKDAIQQPFLHLLNMTSAGGARSLQDGGGWRVTQVTSGARRLFSDEGVINTDPATSLPGAPWVPATGRPTAIHGVVLARADAPFTVHAVGRGGPLRSQALIGPGMAARVTFAPAAGGSDAVGLDPRAGAVEVAPDGPARPAEASVTVRGPGGATVSAAASARAGDAGLRLAVAPRSGRVSVRTDTAGPVRVRLSRVGRSGATAAEVRLRLARGEALLLPPAAWARLGTGSVPYATSRGRRGSLRARRLVTATPAIRVQSVQVQRRAVRVRVRVGNARGGATRVTATLRRGNRVLVTRVATLPPGVRARTFTWSMPRPARGRVRLVVGVGRLENSRGVPVLGARVVTRDIVVR
ncbi:MAG TPA: hypothetical protein VNV66_01310 [Pilimelia sp.]|nr:hypothetical protein [Pilimelia sp.]